MFLIGHTCCPLHWVLPYVVQSGKSGILRRGGRGGLRQEDTKNSLFQAEEGLRNCIKTECDTNEDYPELRIMQSYLHKVREQKQRMRDDQTGSAWSVGSGLGNILLAYQELLWYLLQK